MGTVNIATWQSRDNERIVEIREATQPGRDFDPIDEAGLTEKIERPEHFDTGGALVARVAGEVAGFALAITSPDPARGYLCALMVDPAQQGQGVGSQLLAGAEDFLRASGTQQVCVAPEDCPAMFSLGVNMATPAYSFFLNRGYRCTADPNVWFDLELSDFEPRPEIVEFIQRNSRDGVEFGLCETRHRESLFKLAQDDPGIANAASGTPPYPILVAYAGDRVVGFSGPIGVAASGRGGFMGVVTDPEFQRRKIASVLFEMMCAEMRKRGATYTNLYTGLQYGAQEIYFAAGCRAQYAFDHSLVKRL